MIVKLGRLNCVYLLSSVQHPSVHLTETTSYTELYLLKRAPYLPLIARKELALNVVA